MIGILQPRRAKGGGFRLCSLLLMLLYVLSTSLISLLTNWALERPSGWSLIAPQEQQTIYENNPDHPHPPYKQKI